MDRIEIENVLFEGTKEEIKNIRCECGQKLVYRYVDGTFTVICNKCLIVSRYIKSPVPNCIKYMDGTRDEQRK